MQSQLEFEALRRESASWWAVSQRKLMQETIAKALRGKREGRVLDLGCAAQLNFEDAAAFRVVNAHGSLPVLAFHQIEGRANLVCTQGEELAFTSNCFDTVMCGDLLQSATDDRAVLREIRRVLKDGGLLCVTVPAYMFLWGEEDEEAGHQRRYTASELRRKLTTCGFEIQRVSHFVATGFLPSTIDRAGKNLFKKTAARLPRSSATSSLANSAMIGCLDAERQLMRFINLPFGTRLVCWARKPALAAERVTVTAWERQWAHHPLPQGSSYVAMPESPFAS